MVRKVAREEAKPIILTDLLQGPKIRTGTLVDHKPLAPVMLEAGKAVDDYAGERLTAQRSSVSTVFTTLAEEPEGRRPEFCLSGDGLRFELRVVELRGADVVTEIIQRRGC